MSYLKRKRIGLTNYKKRLSLVSSKKHRLVVRRSLNNITAQIVEYKNEGDIVLISANTKELAKYGWKCSTKNIPSSYLTGLLIGKKATKKNIKDSILDIGLQRPIKKGVLYALLKGAIDSGLNIDHNKNILPEESRIKGEHIANFTKLDSASSFQFSKYKKNNLDPKQITENFNQTKENIVKNAWRNC